MGAHVSVADAGAVLSCGREPQQLLPEASACVDGVMAGVGGLYISAWILTCCVHTSGNSMMQG